MQSTLAHCCDARVAAEGRCVGEVLGMGKRQAAVPVSGRARMYSEPRKRGGWGEGWLGGGGGGGGDDDWGTGNCGEVSRTAPPKSKHFHGVVANA